MNILFFLIPKENVEYVYDNYTIRQVLEKLDTHGYTAIPVLDHEGQYISTISEGDILMYIKNNSELNLKKSENISINNVEIRRKINSITINSNMEDLLDLVMSQNFVPVVDDFNRFIGIITRKDVIKYFYKKIGL